MNALSPLVLSGTLGKPSATRSEEERARCLPYTDDKVTPYTVEWRGAILQRHSSFPAVRAARALPLPTDNLGS